MKNSVVVVGSVNVDLTIKSKRLPRPGETILGGGFTTGAGGKGANQAVAAARAGADVRFVARIGADPYGQEMLKRFRAEGISTKHIVRDEASPTGMAFILVDEHGENSIVVASGANARLSLGDVEAARGEIESAGVLLVQLETPLDTIQRAIRIACESNTRVVVNPAPGQHLSKEWLKGVDVITPNRLEAEMLTGTKITNEAALVATARCIQEYGIPTVVITLGHQGAYLAGENGTRMIPSYLVNAIDSTGAGDVFSGSLAAFLAEGTPIEDATRMAVASASISVTRMGAQSSAPLRNEIETFMRDNALSGYQRTEFTRNPSQSL